VRARIDPARRTNFVEYAARRCHTYSLAKLRQVSTRAQRTVRSRISGGQIPAPVRVRRPRIYSRAHIKNALARTTEDHGP
jgi:hypothetical protein